MTEEQTTSESQEQTTEDKGQETQEQQTEETQEQTSEEQQTETKSYDEDYVKGLRKESAGYRTRAQKAERELKQLREGQDAGMQELSAENANLREENEKLTGQVRRAAFIETIGLSNPRAAWGYVLDGTVEVEYDENHRPQKLDAVRKALREEDPALFGDGSADGGKKTRTGNGYEGSPGLGRLTHAYEQSSATKG